MKNMFNTTCGTIIKTPASQDVRFVIMMSPQQVFSDNKDMEEFIMYMKNMFNNGPHNDETDILGCWCFDNGATHGIEHVLHGPDGLLHVDDVAVHQVWILQIAFKVLCVAHKSKCHY